MGGKPRKKPVPAEAEHLNALINEYGYNIGEPKKKLLPFLTGKGRQIQMMVEVPLRIPVDSPVAQEFRYLAKHTDEKPEHLKTEEEED